jgi:hypothetical protein
MSRQNHALLTLTLAATAAITAHRFVTAGGALSGAAGDALAVSLTDAASGALFPAEAIGTAVIESGAAFSAYDLLQSDATGRAVKAVAASVKQAVIAGGAAGNHTVAGLATTDRLVSVIVLDRDGTAANINLVNLTSEFTITAANTIANADGTATTGDALLVTWESARPVKARALQAATGAGQFIEAFLYPN